MVFVIEKQFQQVYYSELIEVYQQHIQSELSYSIIKFATQINTKQQKQSVMYNLLNYNLNNKINNDFKNSQVNKLKSNNQGNAFNRINEQLREGILLKLLESPYNIPKFYYLDDTTEDKQLQNRLYNCLENNSNSYELKHNNITASTFKPQIYNEDALNQYIQGYEFASYQANKQIEDTICSFKLQQYESFVVSIFDGHGGSELSRFCAINMKKYFQGFIEVLSSTKYKSKKNYLTTIEQKKQIPNQYFENNKRQSARFNQLKQKQEVQMLKTALSKTFDKMQNQFYSLYVKNTKQQSGKQKKFIKNVGTCALSIIVYKGKCLIIANSGDSQSITITDNDKGSYNYKKLNQKLSTGNKLERQRLLKEFPEQNDILVKERKSAYYIKGMLQPTRSIGDYYLKKQQHYNGQGQFNGPYITHKPQITVYQLQQNDKYIIIASDGLWDYMTKWDVLKEVIYNNNGRLLSSQEQQEQRQTASESQDIKKEIKSKPQNLIDKILEKVADQIDQNMEYLEKLEYGQRRQYHDDITIGLIDLKRFKLSNNQ